MGSAGSLLKLAVRIAKEHKLPPALVCAITEKESSWRPWAIRFEPGYRWLHLRNDDVPRFPGVTSATELCQQRTSWGLMQVIGSTARDLGFPGSYMSELCEPTVGLDYGCRFILSLRERFGESIPDIISSYNAGHPTQSNQEEYTTPVLQLFERFRAEFVNAE